MTAYRALMTSLPTGNSTLRMRAWRALRSTGCGVLRDGVYILPLGSPRAAELAEIEAEIKAAGGFAMTVELNLKDSAQLAYVRTLFDRSEDYGALVEKIHAAKSALPRLGKRKADTLAQRLRHALDELLEIDFYPGPASLQAKDAMAALEQESRRLRSPGEPQPAKRKLRRLDPAQYRNRTWATRKNLWVDRMASAWLIRRFVDRNAKFVWIERPRDRPKGSIGFDFDGAEFSHVGSRVTFETLLASFGLEDDSALASIGRAVHFLDTGGIPVAEAKGLETILKGIRERTQDDDQRALEAMKVFDLLYSGHSQSATA